MPFEYKRPQIEQNSIDKEVRKLIRKKVIVTTNVKKGDFFQTFLFDSKKKDHIVLF